MNGLFTMVRRTAGSAAVLASAVAVFPGAPTPTEASEPSFNCKHTGLNPTERTICQTPSLSQLDHQNAAAYKRVMDTDFLENAAQLATVRDSVRTRENAWIKERDSCGVEVACITSAYQKQLAFLTSILSAADGNITACESNDVTLLMGVPDAAMQHSGTPFTYTNATGTTCSLTGYPVIVLYGENQNPVSGIEQTNETSSYLFSTTPIETVMLKPGDVASFGVEFVETGDGTACKGFAFIAAFPPGSDPGKSNRDPVSLQWGGTYCGSMTVVPIRKGAMSNADY